MKQTKTVINYFAAIVIAITVLSVSLIIFSPISRGATPPDNCFAFTPGTGTITNYYNTEGNIGGAPACTRTIDIPATIGGQPVLNIANNAFAGKILTAVTLPNSLVSIGGSSFSSNQLTTVTIPGSVTTIGASAFANNPLVSAEVPSTVNAIGSNAFFRYATTQMTSSNGLVIQPLSTNVGDPSVLYNFSPYVTTIAGVPATIQLSQLAGTPAGVGSGPSYSNIYLPKINGNWVPGLNTTSLRLATGNTVKAEVVFEPGRLESLYLYVTDAESAGFRVYGEDSLGNRVDVTNWVVTSQEAYTQVSPADVPHPFVKNSTDIVFAGAGSQNEDMMLVHIDTASLATMRSFSVEFTEGSPSWPTPGNWIQWGYYAVRAADTVTPEPETPTIPGVTAPNTGTSSMVSSQLFLLVVFAIAVIAAIKKVTRKQ